MDLPIVFINLDRDIDRRHHLEAQLRRFSLTGTRLQAVWWNDLAESEQTELYSADLNHQQYYKPLANGEKGCYASHIAAWKKLLDSTAPALVVLEDDVQILESFPAMVQAIAALQQPWDMVKLIGRDREKISAQQPLVNGHHLIQYRRVPSFTAGYIISRSGAQKLLNSRVPFGRPVDVDLRFWFENHLQIFGVMPAVIALDEISATSSIWSQRARLTPLQRLRKLAMKGKLTLGQWLTHQSKLPRN